MKYQIFKAACLICLLLICAAKADNSLLKTLAPSALVVVGKDAPTVERNAAKRLAQVLTQLGGPAENMVDADSINQDLARAATHDLFVIGTLKSNRVLERLPSHWVLQGQGTPPEHDDQPMWAVDPDKGFYAAGFGTFARGDVGYVAFDRNPYWHYMTNVLLKHKSEKDDDPEAAMPLTEHYRHMARITGNTSQGVAHAVDALIKDQLITGIVAPASRWPSAMDLWQIDAAHLALPAQTPAWVPTQPIADGSVSLRFAGWHMADSMTYAGFLEQSGQTAQKIWRAKYLTEKNWDYPMHVVIDPAFPMTHSPLFDTTLARRASGNEWFIAELANPDLAAKAVTQLVESIKTRRSAPHKKFKPVQVGNITFQRSEFGVHIGQVGRYLIMESFDMDHDALAIKALTQTLTEQGK